MPASSELLSGLTAIATRWQMIAVGWHLVAFAMLMAYVCGWRPSRRLMAFVIASSFACVSGLSIVHSNPFNSVVFALLAVAATWIASGFGPATVAVRGRALTWIGIGLVAFGWAYPHFLGEQPWHRYLYAAPLGLIPCPTLSTAIGVTLLTGLSDCRRWSAMLAAAGVFYGLFGVNFLNVTMDFVLLGGGVVLAVATFNRDISGRACEEPI